MGSWQERLALYLHVTHCHTKHYGRKTKTDKCQEGRKIFTYPKKITGSKTKVPKHGIDSGLQCTIEVFEQISEDMGQKKTPEILSQTEGDHLKSHTFLSENQEFVFGLVEEFRVLQSRKEF